MMLLAKARHDVNPDGATILRSMYDAMLQAVYILKDPAKREERAALFMDFFWIEQERLIRLLDKNPTILAQQVSSSPLRSQHEETLKENLARIRKKYLASDGKIRRNWYSGNLCYLASEVDLEHEYKLVQRVLSLMVHSSPFALRGGGPVIAGTHLVTDAWLLGLRVLGYIAEAAGVKLDKDEQEAIELAQKPLFD